MTWQRLLLFDIDGTLISPGIRPRQWFARSIELHTGKTVELHLEDVMGSTDPLIIRSALKRLAYSGEDIEILAPLILAEYEAKMRTSYAADREPRFIHPGVEALLRKLALSDQYVCGLVTGNLESVARIKLESFALDGYFQLGAFSSDHPQRSRLPAIAMERARELTGDPVPLEKCLLLGDTLGDLEAGRSNGIPVVLVGNGHSPAYREELRSANPDLYLESFEEMDRFLSYLEDSSAQDL